MLHEKTTILYKIKKYIHKNKINQNDIYDAKIKKYTYILKNMNGGGNLCDNCGSNIITRKCGYCGAYYDVCYCNTEINCWKCGRTIYENTDNTH
jgi:hypothetical protein